MKNLPTSVIIGIFSAILSTAPVFAEPSAAKEAQSPKKKVIVRYKQQESHKFGDLNLKGRLKKPELGYIYKRKGLRQEQIVNIPEDFNREILQGAGQF